MFSKINKEFSKHTRAFQVLLLIVIVVPFVFMMPGVDIFAPSGPQKPDLVGTINGEEVSWDTFEMEAKELMAIEALRGNISILRRVREILNNEAFYKPVLDYIADKKIMAADKTFKAGEVTGADMKKFVKETMVPVLNSQVRSFGPTKPSDHIESIRYTFSFGGEKINALVKNIIIRERFNDHIKGKHKPTEEVIIATVKKEERTYKLRTVDIKSSNFTDEPLKEFYDKNKANYRSEDAIQASLVAFHFSSYASKYKEDNYKLELAKSVLDALALVGKDPLVIKNQTKSAKEKFKAKKLKGMASAEAKRFEAAVKAAIKGLKDPKAIADAFQKVSDKVKYTTQDSRFVTKKNVEMKNYFFDKALTESILSVSAEKPLAYSESETASYVLVFKAKGSFTPFEEVRAKILEEVYKEKLDSYYTTNQDQFKRPKRFTVSLAEFVSTDFAPEKVTEADLKKKYDENADYQLPQRKLIQFSYPLAKDAKDKDKEVATTKINEFLKTLEGKKPNEIEAITLKKEDSIKKANLNWVAEGGSFTDTEIMAESFKVEIGKFTKVFVRADMVAVVFAAANRDNTPLAEVQKKLEKELTDSRLAMLVKDKSNKFLEMLKNVKPATVENINKAVADYQKAGNTIKVRDIVNIEPISANSIPQQFQQNPQYMQFFLQQLNRPLIMQGLDQNGVALVRSVNEKRIISSVKTLRSRQKAVAFMKEVFPEGFKEKTDPEVKSRIFSSLNNTDAEKLASESALEIKLEMEKKEGKGLTEFLGTNNFKAVESVKFKNLDAPVKEALKESPAVGSIATNFADASNIIVYVETIKEVTDEEITKLRPEHEKKLTEELQAEKLNEFWKSKREGLKIKSTKTVDKVVAES